MENTFNQSFASWMEHELYPESETARYFDAVAGEQDEARCEQIADEMYFGRSSEFDV